MRTVRLGDLGHSGFTAKFSLWRNGKSLFGILNSSVIGEVLGMSKGSVERVYGVHAWASAGEGKGGLLPPPGRPRPAKNSMFLDFFGEK